MAAEAIHKQLERCPLWPRNVSGERWLLYRRVLSRATERGIRFAIGGGLASMAYAGQWRDIKDLDIYIFKHDRDRMVEIVSEAGLADYYDQKPYDRNWIYRSYQNDTIIDVIWAMANQRAVVDEGWLNGPDVTIGEERFRLVAPEETLWSKLYILQKDRCDWPDALNMLWAIGPDLDWKRLLGRLGPDVPLLHGLLSAFRWLAPTRAHDLPAWLFSELEEECTGNTAAQDAHRAELLDSRPWFTPTLEPFNPTQNGTQEGDKRC